MALALITRMPVPFTALQMLWMNLISDVFPALALTLEPAPPDVMRHAPRPPDEPLIPADEGRRMTRDAVTAAAGVLAAYRWALRRYGPGPRAGTIAFTTAALAEILYALDCGSVLVRSEDHRLPVPNSLLLGTVGGTVLLQLATLFVPALRRLLNLTPLDQRDGWTIMAGTVLPILLAARHRPAPPGTDSHRQALGPGSSLGRTAH